MLLKQREDLEPACKVVRKRESGQYVQVTVVNLGGFMVFDGQTSFIGLNIFHFKLKKDKARQKCDISLFHIETCSTLAPTVFGLSALPCTVMNII